MQTKLLAMLAILPLLAACGGGGESGPPRQMPDPCRDLGLGTAPEALAGQWDRMLTGVSSDMYLFPNGTFVDRSQGRDYPGFWGLDAAGEITIVYSLTSECPPTGTVMTAEGVTTSSTSISGTVQSSPMPGLPAGTPWSITRID
jgi:hypothetical protein